MRQSTSGGGVCLVRGGGLPGPGEGGSSLSGPGGGGSPCQVPGGSSPCQVPGGGVLPARSRGGSPCQVPGGGFSLPGPGGGPARKPPPVNRITHTCKNITLATTSLRPVTRVNVP